MIRNSILAIAMLPLFGAAAAMAQAPGPAPGPGPGGQPPPCVQEFFKLRDAAQARGKAIEAAAKRRAQPQEICGLFNNFVGAEAQMIKYAEANNVWCGIPLQALEQMKNAHIQSQKTRANICKVAASPPRPTGPTLGEALGATPAPNAGNIKKGSGTFDTLTGSPPQR